MLQHRVLLCSFLLLAGHGHAAEDQDQRALLARKAQVEARLETLQQQSGLYGSELQETWLELGDTLQALAQHAAAAEAFDAAWQASRINGGLEDARQVPVLRRLLASQRAAEEWEQADVTAHLIHHISSRAYAPGSPERLEAALQLGRWKLLAARDGLLPNPLLAALNAVELYQREIDKLAAIESEPGLGIQLATLYLEKASADYMAASEIREQPLQDYSTGSQRSTTTMVQCQLVRLPSGIVQQMCTPIEVANLDFYIDPSNRKNQEMWRHLDNMRNDIQQAFTVLNETEVMNEQRDTLLQEMQNLTAIYNDFLSGNRL